MKSLARGSVYWANIDKQSEEEIKQCAICASVAKSPPHDPPEAWPAPSGPWQRLHIDYAGPYQGHYFFLVVDSYSRWPEIFVTTSTTAKTTIQFLRSCFARFGIPNVIVSDNGVYDTLS